MMGYVTRMVEPRNAYRILVGKSLGKWPLERMVGWEDGINTQTTMVRNL
jgi:hypothetical protein